MIYRHTDQQLQDYFDSPAINQSALKVIIDPNGGIEKFADEMDSLLRSNDLYYEEKKHFIIGQAVDTYITQGEEIFKNKYHYSQLKKKPSDAVKSIINMVFDTVNQSLRTDDIMPFINYKEEIYNAANEHKYSMNRAAPTDKQLKDPANAGKTDWWTEDNRWSSMKNAEEYWQSLIEASGKQVLSDNEYNIINNIILSFTTHKHTANLFKDGDNIDIVYQFPMYWQYLKKDCKGLLDMIIINHTTKKIMPIDLKTIGDYILRFPNAVKKRRYDLQSSFYSYGLHYYLTPLATLIGKHLMGYHISDFAFIVESTIKQGTPLIFVVDENLNKVGLEGDGRYLEGWHQGMVQYKEWKAINYSIEEKFKNTNGVVWIDADFEIIN